MPLCTVFIHTVGDRPSIYGIKGTTRGRVSYVMYHRLERIRKSAASVPTSVLNNNNRRGFMDVVGKYSKPPSMDSDTKDTTKSDMVIRFIAPSILLLTFASNPWPYEWLLQKSFTNGCLRAARSRLNDPPFVVLEA